MKEPKSAKGSVSCHGGLWCRKIQPSFWKGVWRCLWRIQAFLDDITCYNHCKGALKEDQQGEEVKFPKAHPDRFLESLFTKQGVHRCHVPKIANTKLPRQKKTRHGVFSPEVCATQVGCPKPRRHPLPQLSGTQSPWPFDA